MEPVFDRLGMVLVASNIAQGGMGTLQLALAGSGIYGAENDFVLWDSSMTEKDTKPQDVFHRQALLSGERVPVLFDMGGGRAVMDRIRRESGAWVGGEGGGQFNPSFKNTTINFGAKKVSGRRCIVRMIRDYDCGAVGFISSQKHVHGGMNRGTRGSAFGIVLGRAGHDPLPASV